MTDQTTPGASDPLAAARDKAFTAGQRLRTAEDILREDPEFLPTAQIVALRADAEQTRAELVDAERHAQTPRKDT
ncbi:hypothetical protein ACIOKD_16595 [Streptomyces sp. NPDC087844]|uniref:hypothetical protein n=1 Tax=Streptomyces sp. NPDC087844 TaxID=3365805 RepID=UPI0037FA4E7F